MFNVLASVGVGGGLAFLRHTCTLQPDTFLKTGNTRRGGTVGAVGVLVRLERLRV